MRYHEAGGGMVLFRWWSTFSRSLEAEVDFVPGSSLVRGVRILLLHVLFFSFSSSIRIEIRWLPALLVCVCVVVVVVVGGGGWGVGELLGWRELTNKLVGDLDLCTSPLLESLFPHPLFLYVFVTLCYSGVADTY
jgi:hypothetical protein